ncbi:Cystatin-C [Camelus dromedarius]|uniref:Cystatin-C n=1 Tax=Camelus dromedarius TaxID=9838 RepID=A0A5N4CVH3_CAMDR|nr:Cystatin-C [Camelus dromedarius]
MRSLLTGGSKSALNACRERGALGSTLVVAGMKYFLEVEIGRTTCTKSQPNLASCPFHDEPHLQRKMLCSFQVHTVPWLGVVSMGKSSCQAE